MTDDICQTITRDFGADLPLVIEALEGLDSHGQAMEGDRLLRATLFLAKGDIERLRRVLARGRVDYRDVLREAEYAPDENRVYDFPKTFRELGLLVE